MPDLAPIHHVKIPVSDVRASSEWYLRVLGLDVAIEFNEDNELRGVALEAPDGSPGSHYGMTPSGQPRWPASTWSHWASRPGTASRPGPTTLPPSTRQTAASSPATTGAASLSACTTPTGSKSVSTPTDPTPHTTHRSPPTQKEITMQYTDSGGPGEPLVLIHAAGFADWFVPVEREPAVAGMRRIRVTRTGYSDPAPAEPMMVADHVDECADLLRRLGIERAQVLAHSSGCVVALQLALDHPDLVDELLLVEPPLIDPLLPPDDRAPVAAASARRWARRWAPPIRATCPLPSTRSWRRSADRSTEP